MYCPFEYYTEVVVCRFSSKWSYKKIRKFCRKAPVLESFIEHLFYGTTAFVCYCFFNQNWQIEGHIVHRDYTPPLKSYLPLLATPDPIQENFGIPFFLGNFVQTLNVFSLVVNIKNSWLLTCPFIRSIYLFKSSIENYCFPVKVKYKAIK